MAAHVTEHVAFQYRREIEKMLGVEMPNEDKPLPENVEVDISRLAKDAAEKLLRKDQTEAQQQQIANSSKILCADAATRTAAQSTRIAA